MQDMTAFTKIQTTNLPLVDPQDILLMAEILHQLIGSLSHCLQGLIHPRWCRVSATNSIPPVRFALVSGVRVSGRLPCGASRDTPRVNLYLESSRAVGPPGPRT